MLHFFLLALVLFSFGCSSKKFENIHFGPGPEDTKIEKEIIEECEHLGKKE